MRWGQPGLCNGEPAGDLFARRAQLHATFKRSRAGEIVLYADPAVSPQTLPVVAGLLLRAEPVVSQLLGWRPKSFFPDVYVYRDAEQLRSVACIPGSGVGYYDGAIHVADDTTQARAQLRETLTHEYTHHALNAMGIAAPAWLHEGLAIELAAEQWVDTTPALRTWILHDHLPFEAMVTAFPHGADDQFAQAAYYQSVMMVRFLRAQRSPQAVALLVQDLATRQTTISEAFETATGLSGRALEDAWSAFVAEP